MKGAYVVSADDGLVGRVVHAVTGTPGWAGCDRAWSDTDHVMLRDSVTGGQFLLYVSPGSFKEDGVPVYPRPGVSLPADRRLTSYLVECRWEEQFVRTVRALAALTGEGVWVIDGDGVVWDAAAVDAAAVRL